jgi:hypothetical protein
MHGPDATFCRVPFFRQMCATTSGIGYHSNHTSLLFPACFVACFCLSCLTFLPRVPSSIFLSERVPSFPDVHMACCLAQVTRDTANIFLRSTFPMPSAPPSYSPAGMDGSAGFPARGQTGGQNPFYTSAGNHNDGSSSLQNGQQNGGQTYANFMSAHSNGGPTSPGTGQPDFGPAFSQQFSSQQ